MGAARLRKTTLARILATRTSMHFAALSAVFSGMADLRKAFDEAARRREYGHGTLLFVDEIHRFNRAQQDGFLPYVENGTVTLVGATTENPSFELNSALLSRCKVFVMHSLDAPALESIIERAETLLQRELPLAPEARATLIELADGDGRYLINLMESVFDLCKPDEMLGSDALLKLSSSAPRFTTRTGKAITISSAPCINPCGGRIRTQPCTGPHACSRAGRTLSTSCAA